MIEIIILNYLLKRQIEGIKNNVFVQTPQIPPDEYVLIEKTSGSKDDHISHAMVAIKSVSNNGLVEAMQITEKVKACMEEMADSENIYSCSLNSDYNYTDTQTKEYRYQAVFNINY